MRTTGGDRGLVSNKTKKTGFKKLALKLAVTSLTKARETTEARQAKQTRQTRQGRMPKSTSIVSAINRQPSAIRHQLSAIMNKHTTLLRSLRENHQDATAQRCLCAFALLWRLRCIDPLLRLPHAQSSHEKLDGSPRRRRSHFCHGSDRATIVPPPAYNPRRF